MKECIIVWEGALWVDERGIFFAMVGEVNEIRIKFDFLFVSIVIDL